MHGQVSRRLFLPLFPRWPEDEVPIGHVTNGVHMPTWDDGVALAVEEQARRQIDAVVVLMIAVHLEGFHLVGLLGEIIRDPCQQTVSRSFPFFRPGRVRAVETIAHNKDFGGSAGRCF